MAEITNTLTVKRRNNVWQCNSYSTSDEALLGSDEALLARYNGENIFFPLTLTKTKESSPLRVKKNNKKYYLQSRNCTLFVTVKVPATTNQSVKLTYYNNNGIQESVIIRDGGSYSAIKNSPYSVELIPDEDYLAGELTGSPMTGLASSDLSWTESSVGVHRKLTLSVPENIKVLVNGKEYDGEGIDYLSEIEIFCESDKYIVSNLKINGKKFVNGSTYTVKEDLKITCDVAIKTYKLSVGATTNQTYMLSVDGEVRAIGSTDTSISVEYGSSYSVVYTADDGYYEKEDGVYIFEASDSVSGIITSEVNIPSKEASLVLSNSSFTLTCNQTENCAYVVKNSSGDTVVTVEKGTENVKQTLKSGTYSVSYTDITNGYTFDSFDII